MTTFTVAKTIGSTGVFSTVQLWEDGAPGNLVTAEQSAAGTFLIAAFVQGESLTFVGSGATGKLLDTDSTGAGNGTYISYGLNSGNPAASDVVTGGSSGATCILSSGTPLNVGVIWQGQCQNQEFSVAGAVVAISGSTDSTDAYKELTTAAGASFRDNASKIINPLRYNAANGAALKTSGAVAATVTMGESFARVSKLQISNDQATKSALVLTAAAGVNTCDSLIIEGKDTGNASTNGVVGMTIAKTIVDCIFQNSVLIQLASAADHIVGVGSGTHVCSLYNCTFVAPDDLATAPARVMLSGTSGTVLAQNCALFAGDSSSVINAGSATFTFTTCQSDISGTSGVTQVTYGNQFVDVNSATRDFRLKRGADAIDAGTADATNAPYDIIGTPRPQGSAYDIGCWELAAPWEVSLDPLVFGSAL